MKLIVPLTKSSWDIGRIGPLEWQDWYRAFRKAVALQRQTPDSKIVIIVADSFRLRGVSEVDRYRMAARREEVPDKDLWFVPEGYETNEQVRVAAQLARNASADLIFVETWLHYWRVRYIARKLAAEHHGVFGLPRLEECFKDPIAIIVYPLLDMTGLAASYKRMIINRRKKGKF